MRALILSRTANTRRPAPHRDFGGMVFRWLGIWSERRALARLDAEQLRDVGISAQAAAKEAARPPWDEPAQR